MTKPTAQKVHTATELYIIDITHSSPKIITSLHFTPHFSLPCTFESFVTTLQNPITSPHLQLLP